MSSFYYSKSVVDISSKSYIVVKQDQIRSWQLDITRSIMINNYGLWFMVSWYIYSL